MCELSVYAWKDGRKELVMESVVRLIPKDGKVLIEGIFGESREVEGTLGEVDIISQTANVIRDQPTPIMNPIKRILPSFRKA